MNEVNITEQIKRVLKDAFLNSEDEKSYYELAKNLECSDKVSFTTNEATLRRTLNTDSKNKSLNLDAMLAMCQYYKIDVNSLLSIESDDSDSNGSLSSLFDSPKELFGIRYIYIKLNDELCSGQLRFFNKDMVTLTINHFNKTKMSYINSNEYYIGKFRIMHEFRICVLELDFSRITNKSEIFNYIEKDKIFITFSYDNLKGTACCRGFLSALSYGKIDTYPFVLSDNKVEDKDYSMIERSLNIVSNMAIVNNQQIIDAISAFVDFESKKSPSKFLELEKDGLISTTIQYLVDTGQVPNIKYDNVILVNDRGSFFIKKQEYIDYIDQFHNCLNLNYDLLFNYLMSFSKKFNCLESDLNEIVNRTV